MMTLDGGWALIISGVLVLVMGGVGTLIWRHVDNARDSGDEAQKSAAKVLEDLNFHKMESLRFQTHVAETYARITGVERMENNINNILARMEVKLDTLKDQKSGFHV
jgi:hypothetical protein